MKLFASTTHNYWIQSKGGSMTAIYSSLCIFFIYFILKADTIFLTPQIKKQLTNFSIDLGV